MQWTLVIMISLCWRQVDATFCLLDGTCTVRNMSQDWKDERWKAYLLEPLDKLIFGSTGQHIGPAAVRQECRTLSDAQRQLLFDALVWLYNTPAPSGVMSVYQVFVIVHRNVVAQSAHFGPCFPPWHREYLYKLEQELRKYNSNVSLCYWDTNLDSQLPNATHSAIWTSEFFGNCDGFVTTGFAANRLAYPADCSLNVTGWPKLYRQCQGNEGLFNKTKVDAILASADTYEQLMTPYDFSIFEGTHGGPHTNVGGHMSIIPCAVNDPIFGFYHTYIDYLWERCRQKQKTNRETEYPNDLVNIPAGHYSFSTMAPMFMKECIDGLSNNYIPALFRYLPSPSNCTTHASCGGKTLWCNSGTCAACVREGGQMKPAWPSAGCYINGCSTPSNVGGTCKCVP